MSNEILGYSATPDSSGYYLGCNYVTTGAASGSIVASADGTCTKMYWYKSETNPSSGEVGIYDDVEGVPTNLLVSASYSDETTTIGWCEVTIPSLSIIAGVTYHPAIMMTTGNSGYDNTSGNNCVRQTNLTTLSDPFTQDSIRTYAPAVYLVNEIADASSIVPSNISLSSIVMGQPFVSAVTQIKTIIGEVLTIPSLELSTPVAYTSTEITGSTLILSGGNFSTPTVFDGDIQTGNLALSNLVFPTISVTDNVIEAIELDDLSLSALILSDISIQESGLEIILFNGAVTFPIDGLDSISPVSGDIVQYCHGAYIQLDHNFNAESGDTPSIAYRDSLGSSGVLQGAFTDSTRSTIKAVIGEDDYMATGKCYVNAIITGTRNGLGFSVHSKAIPVNVFDGIYDD